MSASVSGNMEGEGGAGMGGGGRERRRWWRELEFRIPTHLARTQTHWLPAPPRAGSLTSAVYLGKGLVIPTWVPQQGSW